MVMLLSTNKGSVCKNMLLWPKGLMLKNVDWKLHFNNGIILNTVECLFKENNT